jgi:RHS repeat-associated protein
LQPYDYTRRGTIHAITDSAGHDLQASPRLNTTYTYTGRELEEESGLFYYRARYYDPGVGRFLQKDPDPGKLFIPATTINKYAYVGNNPLSRIDPTGKNWLGDLFVGIVAFAAAFFLAPVAAAFVLGASSGMAFIGLSILFGAAIGGIAGGLTNNAIGNGSFDEGFRIGATVGSIAGGIGAVWNPGNFASEGANMFRGVSRNILNDIFQPKITNAILAPFGGYSIATTAIATANFTYNHISQSCGAAMEFDWKKGECTPKQETNIGITIPFPNWQ